MTRKSVIYMGNPLLSGKWNYTGYDWLDTRHYIRWERQEMQTQFDGKILKNGNLADYKGDVKTTL
jgi:hypothetical protein